MPAHHPAGIAPILSLWLLLFLFWSAGVKIEDV
jgi:hypothetical protein